MTTDIQQKPMWRRLAVPLIVGAIAGGLGAFAFLQLAEIDGGDGLGTSREIAGLVGVLYALCGVAVLLGALNPAVGAKFLNVEDADELREQSRMLVYSGVATLLIGLALGLLALSGEDGFVAAEIGAIVAVASIIAASILSIAMQRHIDELQRALSNDAVASAFYLMAFFGGGWALLAHLDYVAPPAPLDWLTMFAATLLIGAFWQTARRGLMMRGPN